MAYTTTVLDSGNLSISAGLNNLTVSIRKATMLNTWKLYADDFVITAGNDFVSSYDDGVYDYTVVESAVVSGFYHIAYRDIKAALTTKVLTVLNYPTRLSTFNTDQYDFIALTLLGITYFGISDLPVTDWSADRATIPGYLIPINNAIYDSVKYLSTFTNAYRLQQ